MSIRESGRIKNYRESRGTANRINISENQITIFEDSQLKRLDETKPRNHHHQVKIVAKGGSRIRHAKEQVGKSDSDIIVVHAQKNDIKSSSPAALNDDIINTLNTIQKAIHHHKKIFIGVS